MKLSFLDSILAPIRAVATAQRALIAASIERWRATSHSASRQPAALTLFEIPLPRPAAQHVMLHIPAQALASAAPLTLARARIDWLWQCDRVVMPSGKPRAPQSPAAPRLLGTLSTPANRQGKRNLGINVELVLRRTGPTEAMNILQQAARGHTSPVHDGGGT